MQGCGWGENSLLGDVRNRILQGDGGAVAVAGVDVEVGRGIHHDGALIFGKAGASVFDEDFGISLLGVSTNGDGAVLGAQNGALEVGVELVFEPAGIDVEGEGRVGEVEIEGDFSALAKRQGDFVQSNQNVGDFSHKHIIAHNQ